MSDATPAPAAPKNATGTIALVVAGILLFVVCAMAYKDYVDSKAAQDRANWGGQPGGYQTPQGVTPNGQPGNQTPYNGNNGQGVPNNQVNAGQNNFVQGGQPPQHSGNQTNTGYQPPAVAGGNSPVPTQDIFATAQNPANPPATANKGAGKPNEELERRRRELEQLRQEGMINQKLMRDLANGGTGVSTGSTAGGGVVSGPVLPDIPAGLIPRPSTSPGALPNMGIGEKPAFDQKFVAAIDPGLAAQMGPEHYAKLQQEMQKDNAAIARIQNSPAIAQVKLYDSQWNFVEINGGKDRNLKMNQRLTVRRGAKIVGVVKITELGDNYSVAELKSANARRDDTLKPQAGDDLIPEDLF